MALSNNLLQHLKMAAPMSQAFFTTKLVFFTSLLPLSSCAFANYFKDSLFATKTKYDKSYAGDNNLQEHRFDEASIDEVRLKFPDLSNIPGCQPVHVSALFRHGTRYPGSKDLKRTEYLLNQLSDNIDKDLLYQLKRTHTLLKGSDIEKSLSETGKEEMSGLGSRFGYRFQDLFKGCKLEDVLFESTSKSRALASGKAFRSSFVDSIADSNVVGKPIIKIRDDLLRTFDNCTRYINFVEDDPSHMVECNEHRNTFFPEINQKINRIVGKDIILSGDELKSVYVLAASEVAILGSSHWADLFDIHDMAVQEYAADLKSYWKRSYGHRLSYEHVCPLLEDTFTHMDNALMAYIYKKGVFRFAHAETLLPLMTMLGLFNDTEPLRADNFKQQEHRLFKTSTIAPFSSNIAFVLYYCDPDQEVKQNDYSPHLNLPPSYDRYMIQLLFKEIPIRFPFTEYDLARYEDVKRYYKKYIKLCDYKEICGNEPKINVELPHDEL